MFFILSKILATLMMPFTWFFILLLVSLLWKRRATLLRWTAFGVLLVFSNPLILDTVADAWEVPAMADEALGEHHVGVVLGGFSAYDTTMSRTIFRLGADRFNQGLRLLETGKIKKLVISGGSGFLASPEFREARFIGDYLEQINIPERKILIEANSRNTHENATMTAALLKEHGLADQPVVLITSAYHMRRSLACFEKAGLDVVPYTADFAGADLPFTPDLLVPNAQTLSFWNVLFHEWVGYVSYWVMGYV